MQRIPQTPRRNWPRELEKVGFHFHSLDEFNVPREVDDNTFFYWREDAAYAFSKQEVETLYAAAYDLNQRCLEAVQHVVDHDLFARLAIDKDFAQLIRTSWDRDEPTLFGRFDMTLDEHGVPRLYEFNADTPTSLIESAVAQCTGKTPCSRRPTSSTACTTHWWRAGNGCATTTATPACCTWRACSTARKTSATPST